MNEIKGYVTRSVLSTLGLSLYILADTFFIANGVGVLGLAALNIAMPLFNLLTGLGLLLGMGGATLFALKGGKGNYFSQLLIVGGIIGLIFTLLGLFSSRFLALLLGASGATVDLTTMYMRFILVMAPFFIINNLCLAFIRNDQNPQLAMKAMICSSIFNMIFDYIFEYGHGWSRVGNCIITSAQFGYLKHPSTFSKTANFAELGEASTHNNHQEYSTRGFFLSCRNEYRS